MKLTKLHMCETCGGHLTIDETKKIYQCIFCGATYDYAYFMTDDLLQKAKKEINQGHFNDAIELYQFYLKKDPKNFDVRLALMLAMTGFTKLSNVRNPDKMTHVTYIPKDGLKVAQEAPADQQEFFMQLHELLEKGKEYTILSRKESLLRSKCQIHRNNIHTASSRISSVKEQKEQKYTSYYAIFEGIILMCVIFLILAIMLLFAVGVKATLILGGVSLVCALVGFICYMILLFPERRSFKKFESEQYDIIEGHEDKMSEYLTEADALKAEKEKLLAEIRKESAERFTVWRREGLIKE